MRAGKSATAATALGLVIGLSSIFAAPAMAALDPAALEAVQSEEVVQVATDIAALLEGAEPDAEAQEIAAGLHRYLADSVFSAGVIKDALAVVLTGDWTDVQFAALRSLFAEYAPADLKAPSGGGPVVADPDGSAGTASGAVAAPRGGASAQGAGSSSPPPTSSEGGGSDYRP